MAQPFDFEQPSTGSPLQSLPVRLNFNAIGTLNLGPTAPANPFEGMPWIDTSNLANITYKMFLSGAFRVILQNIAAGPPTQGGVSTVEHVEAGPALTWTITHGLGTRLYTWAFFDSSVSPEEAMIPNKLQTIDDDTIIATFSPAQQGRAVIQG